MVDKHMKANGRSTFKEKETSNDGVCLRAVKWFDKRPVTLLSSFAAAELLGEVSHSDKTKKEAVQVPCPSIVLLSKFMGGVDLLDLLITLYRTTVRSKKYYMHLFCHFLDMALVTAWLLYIRDSTSLGTPEEKTDVASGIQCISSRMPLQGMQSFSD